MKGRSKWTAECFMTVAIAIALTGGSGASPPPDPASPPPDERYEEAVLGYLGRTLRAAKKAGRLYYVVPCRDPDYDFPVPFPNISAQAPLTPGSGLGAVREIFRDDKQVTVSEEPEGIIKIRVGEVPAAILQTKIPLLRLSELQRYDETQAVLALTDTKAIRSAMQKLGLKEPATVYNLPLNRPSKPAPHLPAVIKDVTLDQALDIVARTFGVIVVFGECTSRSGPSFIRIHTVDLQME